MKLPDVSLLKTLTQSSEARALEKARALAGEGKLDKAVATLEAALSKTPDSETLLFEAARLLLASSRETDAGECLKKILRRKPRRIDAVLEFIEEVKMKIPAVGSFYDAVAEHFIRQEDYARALDVLERIASEELRVYQGRHLAKWEAVRKNAPQAKLTKTSLHSVYYVALALERQGDYPKAAEVYRSLILKNPEEAGTIFARLQAILARDYGNLPLRLALADLQMDAGKVAEALGQMDQALEVDAAAAAPEVAARLVKRLPQQPDNADLLWLLARARRAEGKFTELLAAIASLAGLNSHAAEVVRLLEELTPKMEEHPPLRLALADCYVAARKPVLAVEAILLASERVGDEATSAALEKVAKAFPDHARTYLLLGDLDFRAGRTARGVERYERVLSLSAEDGPILVPKLLALLDAGTTSGSLADCLARIFLKEGDRARAAVLLRHRVRHDPMSAPEVVRQAREALTPEPAHPGLRIALAEGHLAAGEAVEAIAAIGQLVMDHPIRAGEVLHTLSAASGASAEAARAALALFRELGSRDILPVASGFGRGEAALNAGEVGEAISAFRELASRAPERMEEIRAIFEALLVRHPETTEVRYILAGLYLDRKNFQGATAELKKIQSLNPDLLAPVLTKYREALRTSPDDMEIRLGLSAALLLSRQFEEVQALAADTLRLRDDEATAPIQIDLGDACLERGDVTSAVKRYYNAYRKRPSLAAHAAARLERVLDLHPNLALASLALGKTLPETGRVADAVVRLLEAFRNDPRISEGVLAELDRIRAAHPVSPEAALARVEILCALGKDPAATEAIVSVLESRPESARAMIPRLESILSRNARHAPAFLALARAHRGLEDILHAAEACRSAYRADRGAAPQVIRICSELISQDPKAAVPYLCMAEIYLADGEIAAATEKLFQAATRAEERQEEILEILDEATKLDSGTARVAFLAAEILARFGREAEAVRSFRKALERDSGMLETVLNGYNALLAKNGRLGEALLARAQALALRQEFDSAIADLELAVRATPSLAPEAISEAMRLHERRPGSYRLVSLLTDLLFAAGRLEEADSALELELKRKWNPADRLTLAVRLWRVRLARGETAGARKALAEAVTLAPDRNHLLARVHECVLSQIRSDVNGLRERVSKGEPQQGDLMRLAAGLLDLGESEEALNLTAAGSGVLPTADLLKIHSEAALVESDYFRASEILKPLGPNRRLAFAAERCGDYLLASRTLEQLAAAKPDPEIRTALQRVYRRLILQDLEPGRERLVGETVLRFGT